jgi:cell division septation protein DedD
MVLRFLPWVLIAILLILNVLVFWRSMTRSDEGEIWFGPPLPGKIALLPSRPTDLLALPEEKPTEPPVVAQAPKKPETVKKTGVKRFPNEPLADLLDATSAEKAAMSQGSGSGFLVDVGHFVLPKGADILLRRLKLHGMEARVEAHRELVKLNDVQAGPFPTWESAREAETKLRAGGVDAILTPQETWEGFVISLGQFYLLSSAAQIREMAEMLEVQPVRMVKVERDMDVKRVVMGPYPTREEAKEISSRLAILGLAAPTIHEMNKPVPSLDRPPPPRQPQL